MTDHTNQLAFAVTRVLARCTGDEFDVLARLAAMGKRLKKKDFPAYKNCMPNDLLAGDLYEIAEWVLPRMAELREALDAYNESRAEAERTPPKSTI